MCRNRVKQHLIVLRLDSASINKILVTEFGTVKVLQNVAIRNNIVWKYGL